MDEICVAKFDVYECRKSDRASALSGAQLNICAAQTPEFPDTIPTILGDPDQTDLSPSGPVIMCSVVCRHATSVLLALNLNNIG